MKQLIPENVVTHWSKLYENFSASAETFYESVEEALERRQIPGLRISSITLSEGGLLSPNRTYLRVRADRLILDVCAAPFGTGFFFSTWLVRKRAEWVLPYLVGIAVSSWATFRALHGSMGAMFRASPTPFGFLWHLVLMNPFVLVPISILLVLSAIALLARTNMFGPEDAILSIPILGAVYARLFAPVTYHRLDTIGMFRAASHAAVLEAVDNLTSRKGLRALRPDERMPEFDRIDAPGDAEGEEVLAGEPTT